jgi:hypothetical protein
VPFVNAEKYAVGVLLAEADEVALRTMGSPPVNR